MARTRKKDQQNDKMASASVIFSVMQNMVYKQGLPAISMSTTDLNCSFRFAGFEWPSPNLMNPELMQYLEKRKRTTSSLLRAASPSQNRCLVLDCSDVSLSIDSSALNSLVRETAEALGFGTHLEFVAKLAKLWVMKTGDSISTVNEKQGSVFRMFLRFGTADFQGGTFVCCHNGKAMTQDVDFSESYPRRVFVFAHTLSDVSLQTYHVVSGIGFTLVFDVRVANLPTSSVSIVSPRNGDALDRLATALLLGPPKFGILLQNRYENTESSRLSVQNNGNPDHRVVCPLIAANMVNDCFDLWIASLTVRVECIDFDDEDEMNVSKRNKRSLEDFNFSSSSSSAIVHELNVEPLFCLSGSSFPFSDDAIQMCFAQDYDLSSRYNSDANSIMQHIDLSDLRSIGPSEKEWTSGEFSEFALIAVKKEEIESLIVNSSAIEITSFLDRHSAAISESGRCSSDVATSATMSKASEENICSSSAVSSVSSISDSSSDFASSSLSLSRSATIFPQSPRSVRHIAMEIQNKWDCRAYDQVALETFLNLGDPFLASRCLKLWSNRVCNLEVVIRENDFPEHLPVGQVVPLEEVNAIGNLTTDATCSIANTLSAYVKKYGWSAVGTYILSGIRKESSFATTSNLVFKLISLLSHLEDALRDLMTVVREICSQIVSDMSSFARDQVHNERFSSSVMINGPRCFKFFHTTSLLLFFYLIPQVQDIEILSSFTELLQSIDRMFPELMFLRLFLNVTLPLVGYSWVRHSPFLLNLINHRIQQIVEEPEPFYSEAPLTGVSSEITQNSIKWYLSSVRMDKSQPEEMGKKALRPLPVERKVDIRMTRRFFQETIHDSWKRSQEELVALQRIAGGIAPSFRMQEQEEEQARAIEHDHGHVVHEDISMMACFGADGDAGDGDDGEV